MPHSLNTTFTDEVDKYGDYNLWPALDFKLKNTGDETAIVNKVTLHILESIPDFLPELYFQMLPSSDGDLTLRVVNLGWGPALNVELSLFTDDFCRYLSPAADLTWRGAIEDHLLLTIKKDWIAAKTPVSVSGDQLTGFVKYQDTMGTRHEEVVQYDSVARYPTSRWNLNVGETGFSIEETEPSAMFSMLMPSAVYDVLLEPKDQPYTVQVAVSQVIQPNEADRFQIVVASRCGADYLIKSTIEVDGEVTTETQPCRVPVKFKRFLPDLYYREGLPAALNEASQLVMSRQSTPADLKDTPPRFEMPPKQ